MLFGKHINKYYIKYLPLIIVGIIALIGVDLLQTFIPDYLGEIVGLFRKGEATESTVVPVVLKMLGIAFGTIFGRILYRLCIFNASHRMEANLRRDMFIKAEKLSLTYYHSTKIGSIMSWFTTDIEELREFFGWGTVMLIDALFLGVVVIVKMFLFKWQMAILMLFPIIFIIIWGFLAEKIIGSEWFKKQKIYDELYDYSQETFAGIRVIKAFVQENHQIRAFAKVAKKNRDSSIKFARIWIIFDMVIEVLCALIVALVLGFGGYFVICTVNNSPVSLFGSPLVFQVEDLIQFLGYFDTLVWPLIAMGQIVTMYARANASLKRVSSFLDADEDIKNCENPIILENIKGKIEFRNLSFKYKDADNYDLKNVSFVIQPGEKIGIVGKIGCGKSTLANLIPRLYNVENNTLFVDDYDIMKADVSSLRNAIAYVPQENFLFSDSIQNNIAFSNKELSLDDVQRGAKFSNIHDDIEEFSQKYETMTGERGVTLSGGQKQRISIARAYIKDAPILIMDDSVSAVDVKTEEQILQNIAENRKGKTTLIIASRVSTVSKLDKILVLKDGEVEAFDTPKNLLKTSETYKNMVRLQELEKEVNS